MILRKVPKKQWTFMKQEETAKNFTKELKDDFNGGILSHKDS